MKKAILAISVASLLSACGSTGSNRYTEAEKDRYDQQVKQAKQAVSEAPKWMVELPKSTNAVYQNGTATSTDMSMATMKAKAIAYAKICTAAGGTVRQQTKVFRSDNNDVSIENSELAIRSLCADTDITGVETVEQKIVAEGNRIRTYVLVALPIGSANSLKSAKQAEKRAPEAFRELDALVEGQKRP